MNLAIVGSRNFHDENKVIAVTQFLFDMNSSVVIISGGAKGADAIAKNLAKKYGCQYREFLPRDGATYAQKCYNRNKEIVDNSDVVLAFWDGRIEHCGTLLTMQYAVQQGKRMYCIGVKA